MTLVTSSSPDGLPVHAFATPAEWAAWLERHHADSAGLWVRIAKKGSGIASVTKAEALETALCYGWIDGRLGPGDAATWLVRFTPRRARSKWSRVNRTTAERLIAEGRMRPAGLREVEAARRDGRWEAAYPSQRGLAVPEDLQARLDASPVAKAFFAGLDSRNRYAILYRLHDAKRPETRQRRLEQFVRMLEAGETIY